MTGMMMGGEPPAEPGMTRTRLDRMYHEWLDGREPTWTPAIDIVRQNGRLVVRADLPGVKPGEVRVDVEDDVLTVSGEPEEHTARADGRYLRRERRGGSFCRSILLPPGVDAAQVTATTRDGVVEVTIPLPAAATGCKRRPSVPIASRA